MSYYNSAGGQALDIFIRIYLLQTAGSQASFRVCQEIRVQRIIELRVMQECKRTHSICRLRLQATAQSIMLMHIILAQFVQLYHGPFLFREYMSPP